MSDSSELCLAALDLLEEEDLFHFFFSIASSISICSCLHSWLQNGVFPLQKSTKLETPLTNSAPNLLDFHLILPVNEDVVVLAERSAAEGAGIEEVRLVVVFASGVVVCCCCSWAHRRRRRFNSIDDKIRWFAEDSSICRRNSSILEKKIKRELKMKKITWIEWRLLQNFYPKCILAKIPLDWSKLFT